MTALSFVVLIASVFQNDLTHESRSLIDQNLRIDDNAVGQTL